MLLDHMAEGLSLPHDFIRKLAHSASHHYKVYRIPKRTGGERVICHPSKQLKAMQRWLLGNVVSTFPIHDAAYAYREKLNIYKHARMHRESRYLLRMDFKEFFPSLTAADIAHYLETRAHHPWITTAEDRNLFCAFVCRRGKLTIGSPTSPAISNALCWDLDSQLTTAAGSMGATYTRYADDIYFSTHTRDTLSKLEQLAQTVVNGLQCPSHLAFNSAKTRHTSRKRRRTVAGLTLGSDGQVYVPRELKRQVRAMVHQYEDLAEDERPRLAGMIAYISGIEPGYANSLIQKYGLARYRAAANRRDPNAVP